MTMNENNEYYFTVCIMIKFLCGFYFYACYMSNWPKFIL